MQNLCISLKVQIGPVLVYKSIKKFRENVYITLTILTRIPVGSK